MPGRISEVAARFTLDAMPGKQMAIDADLNAGLINESEARERRAYITQEAEFYGSMDGAAKFVKGDAIASLIITLINIAAGFIIGMTMMGMDAGQALQTLCYFNRWRRSRVANTKFIDRHWLWYARNEITVRPINR